MGFAGISPLPRLRVQHGVLPGGHVGPVLTTTMEGTPVPVVLRGANYIRLNGSQGSGLCTCRRLWQQAIANLCTSGAAVLCILQTCAGFEAQRTMNIFGH